MILDALKNFHKENGCLPEKIMVYRDGVGDGQVAAVYAHEVPQMIETIREVAGADYMYV